MLEETVISRAILTVWKRKLEDSLELDVAIAGGGPSGLVAGRLLAEAGKRVALFERRLSLGGGVWGGGMMMNEVVVQEEARGFLERLGISPSPFREGYYTVDSVYLVCTLAAGAFEAGLKLFNLVSAEDVVLKDGRVSGLVLNWGAVEQLGWPIDPLTVSSGFVLDATGHQASIVSSLCRKNGVVLRTESGGMIGEMPMSADLGERHAVENTREVYPGLFVSGMAANATFGGYRMGPVFGGMLLSGKKAAEEILALLG